MQFAMLEIGIKCPKCDGPLPLNGPLETAHCDRCQADIDVPHEFWKDILSDIHEEVKGELEVGDGRQSTIFGTFNVTLTYYHVPPHCTKCDTAFEVDEGLTQPYTHTCAECGRKVEVLPAPEWLVKEYPPAKILIDAPPATAGVEGAEKGEGKDMEKSAVSTPIAFTCPQCGGALMVDGSDRLVRCQYCSVDVYLPDDLWLRMHPAKVKESWLVGFS